MWCQNRQLKKGKVVILVFHFLKISPQSPPCHLLYEANPTYYLSFIPALYTNCICLTSTPIITDTHLTTLSNWLLSFITKFLNDQELDTMLSELESLFSHPGFAALPPRSTSSSSSSSSSSSAKKQCKSLG